MFYTEQYMYGLSVIWPTASVQDEARRGLAQLRRILLPHALGHARGEGVQRVAAGADDTHGVRGRLLRVGVVHPVFELVERLAWLG